MLKIRGYHQEQTEDMRKGKEKHEELLKIYPNLAQFTYERYRKQLAEGKTIILQETFVCSSLRAIHGVIDKLEIKYTDNTMNVEITDIKPHLSAKNIIQLASYAVMLSDLGCTIGYETFTKRKHKRKIIMCKLYPSNQFKLNITIRFEFYNQLKQWKLNWMQDNMPTPQAQAYTMAIAKKAKLRRALHKEGLFWLNTMPPCTFCQQSIEKCSLYKICQKIDYKPIAKEHQLFHGKVKLLVQNKPTIKR